jgi:hypothetical protein
VTDATASAEGKMPTKPKSDDIDASALSIEEQLARLLNKIDPECKVPAADLSLTSSSLTSSSPSKSHWQFLRYRQDDKTSESSDNNDWVDLWLRRSFLEPFLPVIKGDAGDKAAACTTKYELLPDAQHRVRG